MQQLYSLAGAALSPISLIRATTRIREHYTHAIMSHMRFTFGPHSLERLDRRRSTEAEVSAIVEDAIALGTARPNRRGHGRLQVSKVLDFNAEFRGVFYSRKLVTVIFVWEPERDTASIITVITKFGRYDE